MKQFLKKLALFLGIIILIYPTLIYLWFQYLNNHFGLASKWPITHYSFTRVDLDTKPADKVNFLFLGSSHAYCSFNPEVFEKINIKTYNLGTANQSPYYSKFILDSYLEKLNPDYIILEVYAMSTMNNSLECAIDLAYNHPFKNTPSDYLKILNQHRELRVLNGLFYNFFSSIFRTYYVNSNKRNKLKGYSLHKNTVKISNMNIPPKSIDLSPQNKENLNHLVDFIVNKLNRKLIFVYAPIPHKIYNSVINHDDYISFIKDISLNSKIPFYNFNLLNSFDDDKHFFDNDGHLNYEGGLIFNQMLIDSLKKDGIIQ